MWARDHFGSGSQRNEQIKLAASFWNNVGAGMVIGDLAAAFFSDKPSGTQELASCADEKCAPSGDTESALSQFLRRLIGSFPRWGATLLHVWVARPV
jgi:hypothetical protein